jgi:apolipoprotein N-acyltransferase
LFPKNGWIVQWLIWIAYEYVKTLGFVGFHYGVTGYSHWKWTPLIQIADITGVWGLSALIVFVSAWIAAVMLDSKKFMPGPLARRLLCAARGHTKSAVIWAVFFLAAVLYGIFSPVDYSNDKTIKVALIQSNSDPWLGGAAAMRADLETLMRLSSEAIQHAPDTELVVWPETAFVPRITYHYRRRIDRERFEMVERLLRYIDGSKPAFVIGNDHAQEGYTREGKLDTLDYNAALLFEPGKNVIPPEPVMYGKMHLVPFTEYFPYEKQFPALYKLLLKTGSHMWEPGKTPFVFETAGLRFGSPVCFEDTFGYIARLFVKNGAQALVNLSNDAWSKSASCQYQHLSMALFRSVENRVPSVRSTASGQTVIIDPNGKIIAMAEPFTEAYVSGDIPVRDMRRKTLYTVAGDWFGVLSACAAALALIVGIIQKRRNHVQTSHDK